jgi:hypothetical protein
MLLGDCAMIARKTCSPIRANAPGFDQPVSDTNLA